MKSNVQKMREALGEIIALCSKRDYPVNELCEIERIAEAALAIPLRNCNVGTAEEQEKRFDKFCDAHKWVDDEGVNACSAYCPLYKTTECALHWAQMPYEETEGGAK